MLAIYAMFLVLSSLNSFSFCTYLLQAEEDNVNEYEVWHGLANLYSSLSHWKDAETCLEKARALIEYSADTLHTEGKIMNLIYNDRSSYFLVY